MPTTTRRQLLKFAAWSSTLAAASKAAFAAGPDLLTVNDGTSAAPIVVSATAGKWERRAADDLAQYVGQMTGLRPQILTTIPPHAPAIIVGKIALDADPRLVKALSSAAKPNPVVQADAILVRRSGNRLYVTGSNDEAHYFAASWLLQQWGCRWYMPGSFGEHVPHHQTLTVGVIDHLYAPPFEIRHYWLSWNGDGTGADYFRHRNFMSFATLPGAKQTLDNYTSALAPAGSTAFNVPFADPATAEHVASQIAGDYAAGRNISLAIADGLYTNDDPRDRALIREEDHFMMRPSLTDAMLTLYNNVARIMRRSYPASTARIGGMAYANVTMPPRIVTAIEPSLVLWLAPIDIDPNHSADDVRSPPRRLYGDMVRRWARLFKGRLVIYDYDQAMLVWRDLPNPSHHVFARDVKLYRSEGVLGIGTESRGAFATTFLNLFFRGQLMWNPDADVGTLLREFYVNFYGSAAEPMRRYWDRIFSAWATTIVTEHEYPVVPAIYTAALVASLRVDLEAAERLAATADETLVGRLRFTRLSFDLIAATVAMVTAAAADCDYAAAIAAGERAIATRLELARMNPTFTVHVVGSEAETASGGVMWLPGEVEQYRDFLRLTNGTKGRLITRLPLNWAMRQGLLAKPAADDDRTGSDGAFIPPAPMPGANGWLQVRTDLFLQAQGFIGDNEVNALGQYWLRTDLTLDEHQRNGRLRLMFPGLFNEAWLFINGQLVAHRTVDEPWWETDYRFEWDVAVGANLVAGTNNIVLRGYNPHHFAGMFRRPFLYAPT
jgi:hypothetical protein